MRKALIAVVLPALILQPVRGAKAVAPSFDFVLEIAGHVIQRRINSLEGVSVIKRSGVGGPVEVVVDNVYAEARGRRGPYLRLMVFARATDKGGLKRTAQVTVLTDARLDVVRDRGGATVLRITALSGTCRAAAEAPVAAWAKEYVECMAGELARKLAVDVPLEGLDVIASARGADSPPMRAEAYELGFGWVLQICGPAQPVGNSAPRVFLIGDAFSMIISAGLMQRLADQQFAAGDLPRSFSDQGMPQPDGPIRVEKVNVALARDTMSLTWEGRSDHAQPALVTWDIGFADSPDGLVLDIRRAAVNGGNVPLPESAARVNPVDELIKNVMFGPVRGTLFDSPLGRVKITTGRITPDGIFIAGRA